MRGWIAFGMLGLLAPLSGCGEGTAAPAPQARVEPPQPRVLKPEPRQTPVPSPSATPTPAPASAPATKTETKPGPAAAERKVEQSPSAQGDQIISIQVPASTGTSTAPLIVPAKPSVDGPIRIQLGRRPGENRGSEESRDRGPRKPGGKPGGNDEVPGELPFDVPGPDRGRQYRTPPLPAGLPSWFAERDHDKDGQVGMYEWPKDQLGEFAKCDKNGDGYITPEELVKIPAPGALASAANGSPTAAAASLASPTAAAAATPLMITQPFPSAGGEDERTRRMAEDTLRRYDRNNDGRLDAQEVDRSLSLRTTWQQYDANKDGLLDLTEVANYVKTRFGSGNTLSWGGTPGGPSMGFGGPPGGGGPGLFGGPPGRGGERNDRDRGGDRGRERGGMDNAMFTRFDQNHDGKLVQDEMPGFFRERFSEWDANKDGAVDAQELSSGMENMRRSFGSGRGRP